MKRHSIEEGNELPACRVKSSLSTTKRQRDVVLPAASVGNAPVWKQNAQAERIDKPQNSQKSATLRPGSSNPTQVLLVRVSDITHPVTIGALHTIFSRYGEVCKVVTFDKGAGFQALIQFRSVQEAIQAHSKADGMFMYPGCNHIRVGFSNQSDITVKTNSERGWDYMQERAQSGPPPLFVGEGNMSPQQQVVEMPYLLPHPISAFPTLLQQPQINEHPQQHLQHQQRFHPQQGPYYPVGGSHYTLTHLQQQQRQQQHAVRQYLPQIQYSVVPVHPPSGPLYYSPQVMNHYTPSSQPIPPTAIGCSDLNWQGDIRVTSGSAAYHHHQQQQQQQQIHNMGPVPTPPHPQGNVTPSQYQWQNISSQDSSSSIQGVSTQIRNEIGVLQSDLGIEEQWQQIDESDNVIDDKGTAQSDIEEDDERLVGSGMPCILDPPQLSEFVDCWMKEDVIGTEHGQTATDTDKLAVETAKVSFTDEEQNYSPYLGAKDDEEHLAIEGGGKPTQTKDKVAADVLQLEVEPQEEDLDALSEDIELPWDVANDMAQKDGYTTMLLVQGFNAVRVKASAIAQLFGCYGDVLKAQQAVKWLDGQPLGGRKISVVSTADSEISSNNSSTLMMCMEWDSSWFYRFSETKGPGDKRYQEALCPPSPVIIFDLLPEESTEETLATLVESIGGLISVNKGIGTTTRKAILQFDMVENAIHALIFTHGLPWLGNRLKASFMNPCLCLLSSG